MKRGEGSCEVFHSRQRPLGRIGTNDHSQFSLGGSVMQDDFPLPGGSCRALFMMKRGEGS